MQEQEYSAHIRLSLVLHIACLNADQGDEMVKDLIEIIESGTTEAEFWNTVHEKYGITMVN
jgi:hypothetical protein